MLNDIKIVFYEDDKFKHQTGELKLVNADFIQLELIVNSIRRSQNELGYPCHFKIIAQTLPFQNHCSKSRLLKVYKMKSVNLKFGLEKSTSTTPDPLGIVYFLPSAICIAVETALSLVNGKSKEHTFTSYSKIAELVQDAESGLEKLGILKKDAAGAKFIAYSGGTVASSYKYSRIGTSILLERKSSGWHLTSIKTYNLYQKPPHNQFILTEKQDACAIASLRQKYNIEKA